MAQFEVLRDICLKRKGKTSRNFKAAETFPDFRNKK